MAQKRPQKCTIDSITFSVYRRLHNSQTFFREAVIWRRLVHPNVLLPLGITVTPVQLISNWMPGGDLPEYINKNSDADRLGLVGVPAVVFTSRSLLLQAVRCRQGSLLPPFPRRRSWGPQGSLCFFKISPFTAVLTSGQANVLVDDSGHARVTDFGLAGVTQSLSHQHIHTVRWTAPEVLKEGPLSKEADIFSFAMVMIEVSHG